MHAGDDDDGTGAHELSGAAADKPSFVSNELCTRHLCFSYFFLRRSVSVCSSILLTFNEFANDFITFSSAK